MCFTDTSAGRITWIWFRGQWFTRQAYDKMVGERLTAALYSYKGARQEAVERLDRLAGRL